MSARGTIREHAEAIRAEGERIHEGDPFLAFVQAMHTVTEHAVAILDILDEAKLDILASTDAHGNPSLANAHLSIPDPGRRASRWSDFVIPPTPTVRETLNGHDWIRESTHASCACGWQSPQPDQLHCYAAFITHLSERMYAAIALLDAAHRENAHEHGDGLVVIPDTPRNDVDTLKGASDD